MALHDFAVRPSVEITRARVQQAERLNLVFDRFDVVCREMGFLSYGDFVASVRNFERSANLPVSHSQSRRAGLRGTGKRAMPEDLAAAKKLATEGKSLAEISRTLGLSYQTTVKFAKHDWMPADEWRRAHAQASSPQSPPAPQGHPPHE